MFSHDRHESSRVLLDLANGNLQDVSVPSELEDKVQMGNSDAEIQNGKPSPAVVHEVSYPKRQWGASWWEQYSILFWRGIKERRHEYFSWLRIFQVLSTAFILGLLWWQSDSNSPKACKNSINFTFCPSAYLGNIQPSIELSQLPLQVGLLFFIAIFTFPQERAMLSKERAADMYRLSLRLSAGPFFLSLLTVFLCIVAAQGLGLAIGATLMDLKRATTLASVTVMTFMLAGGFFVQKVPIFISWIRYLSFNYHTFKLLLKVQYEHITPTINGMRIDNGIIEVSALVAMWIRLGQNAARKNLICRAKPRTQRQMYTHPSCNIQSSHHRPTGNGILLQNQNPSTLHCQLRSSN
ncbi:hypothetical protein I3842_11G071300 [Carya illinoinensis]|uniref:ABC-2 type transporter transmembrane domain-containing protein n=1 Tax=Carya illinoinensis TaxID=32201 RepID=A0A922DMR5_CARIL|nr:hypothetical protein I3842_11G071300 [Carya illinoinensis]